MNIKSFHIAYNMSFSCDKIFLLASRYLSFWSWPSLDLAIIFANASCSLKYQMDMTFNLCVCAVKNNALSWLLKILFKTIFDILFQISIQTSLFYYKVCFGEVCLTELGRDEKPLAKTMRNMFFDNIWIL